MPNRTAILGYASPLAVQPGETLSFHLSSPTLDSAELEVVKVRSGDADPAGPGLRYSRPGTPIDGRIALRHQPLRPGSCLHVEDTPAFAALQAFSFACHLWPTCCSGKLQTHRRALVRAHQHRLASAAACRWRAGVRGGGRAAPRQCRAPAAAGRARLGLRHRHAGPGHRRPAAADRRRERTGRCAARCLRLAGRGAAAARRRAGRGCGCGPCRPTSTARSTGRGCSPTHCPSTCCNAGPRPPSRTPATPHCSRPGASAPTWPATTSPTCRATASTAPWSTAPRAR